MVPASANVCDAAPYVKIRLPPMDDPFCAIVIAEVPLPETLSATVPVYSPAMVGSGDGTTAGVEVDEQPVRPTSARAIAASTTTPKSGRWDL
jgi:hypothetical protein